MKRIEDDHLCVIRSKSKIQIEVVQGVFFLASAKYSRTRKLAYYTEEVLIFPNSENKDGSGLWIEERFIGERELPS